MKRLVTLSIGVWALISCLGFTLQQESPDKVGPLSLRRRLVKRSYPSNINHAVSQFGDAFTARDNLRVSRTLEYIKPRFAEALRTRDIRDLSAHALISLLSQPYIVHEIEVFDAVRRWLETNREWTAPNVVTGILSRVHLVALSVDELHSVVAPSGLYFCNETTQALAIKASRTVRPTMLRFDYQLAHTDVALAHFGAELLSGDWSDRNNSGTSVPSVLRGQRPQHTQYAFHNLTNQPQGITIKLATDFILNTVIIHLFDTAPWQFKFQTKLSPDRSNWRLVDNDEISIWRSGVITIMFPEVKARYLRVVGTAVYPPNATTTFNVFDIQALYR